MSQLLSRTKQSVRVLTRRPQLQTQAKRTFAVEYHAMPQNEKAWRKLYLTCGAALLVMSYFGSLLHGTPAQEHEGIDMKHEQATGSGALKNTGAATH